MYERESSRILAERIILNRPSGDPDDDLAVLARQLLRADEEIERLRAEVETWKDRWESANEALNATVDEIRRVTSD